MNSSSILCAHGLRAGQNHRMIAFNDSRETTNGARDKKQITLEGDTCRHGRLCRSRCIG
jgi:hypothetical protein